MQDCSAHPSPEDLFAFRLGLMETPDSQAVQAHVDSCRSCRQRLSEPLPDELPTARQEAPDALPPTCRFLPEDPPPGPPAELDGHPRYRVTRLLGRGGMGAVYQAEHTLMDRPVALKVVKPELVRDPEALARFRKEVRAAARLSHPNIVTAHDAEQAGELTFFVMEHVEGQSLAEHLRRGPLPLTEACQYVRQAALGLQHAHERGMVHRDIKPANLMVTPSGEVKVLDFGLARFASEEVERAAEQPSCAGETLPVAGRLTQTGQVMGTVDYVAPEQARDASRADIRADIYSLGATLYHCLTGRPPYPDGDAAAKLARLGAEAPVAVSRLRPEVPAGLAAVLERMMARRPEHRYQTPAEVAAALAPFAGLRGPRRRTRRRVAVLASVAVLAAVGTVAVFALRGAREAEAVTPARPVPVSVIPETLHQFGGTGPAAHGLAVSPDGRFAVSSGALEPADDGGWKSSRDADLRVWDLASGQEIGRLTGHNGHIGCVAFAPDGRKLAAAAGHERTVRVWDVVRGTPLLNLTGHEKEVMAVVFTSDGRRVLSAGWDRTLRLWDAVTGTELGRVGGSDCDWGRVAVTMDGRFAAAGGLAAAAWIDLATGQEVRRFTDPRARPGRVTGLAVSPDGRLLLTGFAETPDRGVHLWETETGRLLRVLGYHTDDVSATAFTPDGGHALSASRDGTVRVWSLPDGVEARRFATHSPVLSLAVTPDGRHALAGCADRTVRVLPLTGPASAEEPGEVQQLVADGTPVGRVAASLDGRFAFALDGKGALRAWDLEGRQAPRRVNAEEQPVAAFVLTQGGTKLLCADRDGRLCLRDSAADALPVILTHDAHQTTCLAAAADGRALTGTADGRLVLWDGRTGKRLKELGQHAAAACAVAVSADGRLAVAAFADRTAVLLDLETGAVRQRMTDNVDLVLDVAFAADGRRFLTPSGPNNCPRLWNADTGDELRRIRSHAHRAGAVALSPDGRWALTGAGDGFLRLYDTSTTGSRVSFFAHHGPVTAAVFCRGGSHVLTGGADGTVRLWRLPDPPSEAVPAPPPPAEFMRNLDWPGAQPSATRFSPDGRFLLVIGTTGTGWQLAVWETATGKKLREVPGFDGRITPDGKHVFHSVTDDTPGLTDLATGEVVHRFAGHNDRAWAADVSPDGSLALTGGLDQIVRLWSVATGEERRQWTFAVPRDRRGHLHFTPDGGAVWGWFPSADGQLILEAWDVKTGEAVRSLRIPELLHVLRILPDGKEFVALRRRPDGTFAQAVCATADGRLVREYALSGPPIAAVSPDGRWSLGASTSSVFLRDTLAMHLLPQAAATAQPAFSADGRFLAVGTATAGRVTLLRLHAKAAELPPTEPAFREAHGLDEKAFQRWADALPAKGFRLATLSVCAGSRSPRFNGVAVRDSRHVPTRVRLGLVGAEPGQYFNTSRRLGYRPVVSCLYADGDRQKQAHVWAWDGLSFGGFGTTFAALSEKLETEGRAKKLMPTYLSAETRTASPDKVTLILTPAEASDWEVKPALGGHEWLAQAAAWRKRGWRPTHVTAYEDNGEPLFVAIGATNSAGTDWDCRADLTEPEYEAALAANARQGLRPRAVASYLRGGGLRYAAVWERFRP